MASFVLPAAAPDAYLRWMAFWREVEQTMGQRPELESSASQQAAPFLRDDVARELSTVLIPALVEQARQAASEGRASVLPEVDADPALLVQALDYVARRSAFLTPEICRAMGVEPLDPPLERLRQRVLESLQEQLAARS